MSVKLQTSKETIVIAMISPQAKKKQSQFRQPTCFISSHFYSYIRSLKR